MSDGIGDQVLAVLRAENDWMTDKEILASFNLETTRADIWKALQSLARQKLIQGKATAKEGSSDAIPIRWRAIPKK